MPSKGASEDRTLSRWIEAFSAQPFIPVEELLDLLDKIKPYARGRGIAPVAAAAVYYRLRQRYGLVSKDLLAKLCEIYGCSEKKVLAVYKKIFGKESVVDYHQAARRAAELYNIDPRLIDEVARLMQIDSRSSAAAALYLAAKLAGKEMTEEQAASTFEVTEVSLRVVLRKLRCRLGMCNVWSDKFAEALRDVLGVS